MDNTTESKGFKSLTSVFTYKFDLNGLLDLLTNSGILKFLVTLIIDLM